MARVERRLRFRCESATRRIGDIQPLDQVAALSANTHPLKEPHAKPNSDMNSWITL